jgi:predicted amidohydrolase YtcJ
MVCRKAVGITSVVGAVMLPSLSFAQALVRASDRLMVYPEVILHNGKILTADDRFSVHQALAIRDGRFFEVGTNQQVLQLRGPETRVIDLRGRSVVPGFIDTHLHNWRGSTVGSSAGELTFESLDGGLAEIRDAITELKPPPGEWLVFSAVRNKVTLTEVTRWDLDKAAPANPIRLSLDTSLGIVNSLGWEKIHKRVEGMPGIIIDKERNEPNGHIRGQANGTVTYEEMQWQPDWETTAVEQEKQRQRIVTSQGLTTNIGRVNGVKLSVLKELWRTGELRLRVRPTLEFIMYSAQAEELLKRLGNLQDFGDDWMKIAGLTVGNTDGTNSTGGMLTRLEKKRGINIRGGDAWEALGMPGENKWQLGAGSEDYKEVTDYKNIILANRYGWSVGSIHAQGDIGAKLVLDAFEEANEERPIRGRHFAFDHGLVRTPEDIKRAVELGAIMSFAPKYLFSNPDGLVWQFGEYVHGMTPVKTAMQLGMKPVMESDISGYRGASLWNIQALITRADEKGRVWGAKEALSREDALRMRTAWAASYSGDQDELGTIEVGKLGDVVVLGGDYLTVPADQIAKLPVDYTIVGGKIVYDRERDGLIDPGRSYGDEGER